MRILLFYSGNRNFSEKCQAGIATGYGGGGIAELLGGEEKAWLNAYNKEVRRLSKQYLTKEEFAWLTQYTKEI